MVAQAIGADRPFDAMSRTHSLTLRVVTPQNQGGLPAHSDPGYYADLSVGLRLRSESVSSWYGAHWDRDTVSEWSSFGRERK